METVVLICGWLLLVLCTAAAIYLMYVNVQSTYFAKALAHGGGPCRRPGCDHKLRLDSTDVIVLVLILGAGTLVLAPGFFVSYLAISDPTRLTLFLVNIWNCFKNY